MEGEAGDDNIEAKEGETMHHVNEFFFLTDPDELIYTHFIGGSKGGRQGRALPPGGPNSFIFMQFSGTKLKNNSTFGSWRPPPLGKILDPPLHLPDSPKWQLLDEEYTLQKFENKVYVRERFFDMGVAMVESSKRDCILKTENGEIQVVFGLSGNNSKSLQFRFLLYRAKQVSRASIAHFPLERYVFYQKSETSIEYNNKFPVSGRFKMDLFGKNDEVHENFDLVCSYMIDCPLAAMDVDALPDNPDIGWGPAGESERVGLVAKSHEKGVINSNDGKIEM